MESMTYQDEELISSRKRSFVQKYSKWLYACAGMVFGGLVMFAITYGVYHTGKTPDEPNFMQQKGRHGNASSQLDTEQLTYLLDQTYQELQHIKNSREEVLNLLEDIKNKTCRQTKKQDKSKVETTTTDISEIKTTTTGLKVCKGWWKEFNGHCYFISTDRRSWQQSKTWHQAENECKKMSSNLVKIDDMAENQWISRQAGVARPYWIGAHDIAMEDKWIWSVDSSRVNFTDWAEGEPNEKYLRHDEDCAILNWGGKGRWWDYICSKPLAYICEKNKA